MTHPEPNSLDDIYGPGAEDASSGEPCPHNEGITNDGKCHLCLEPMFPLWICVVCKTVIGTIVDDGENTCKCKDVYAFEHWRVAPATDINYPRATKLMSQGKKFLVVASYEPYYHKVYRMIREQELAQGTWTIEDEKLFLSEKYDDQNGQREYLDPRNK